MTRLHVALVGAAVLLGIATAHAGPRDVAALKGEIDRLEGIADLWEPLSTADGWCLEVAAGDYSAFARDVGLAADTAAIVLKGRKRLAERVTELRGRLAGLDERRGRCREVDAWTTGAVVIRERSAVDALGAVDDLRVALDRWKATFEGTSPPGFTDLCAEVLTAALTPAWPEDWRTIDRVELRERAAITRALPECGAAAADAGRKLHATRAVVRELRAANDAAVADPLGAEEILAGLLASWPPDAHYGPEVAEALRGALLGSGEGDTGAAVERCRRAPEECAFEVVRRRLTRLSRIAAGDAPRAARVAELIESLDATEAEWVRFNRSLFGAARTLDQVDMQQRWIDRERTRLQSAAAAAVFDAWASDLQGGSVGLRKQRTSLLGGTDVRVEGDQVCGTDGAYLGPEWGPRGETQARLRRFVRELRDTTGLREPSAILRGSERGDGDPERCDQVLIVTAELTSCAVESLWEPELPRALDRYYGQASGARLHARLLSPVRALIPAKSYSVRLKNRAGRTYLVEMGGSGSRVKEYLDGVSMNPQSTDAIRIEYVDVLKAVLADVRACP